jgi:cell division septation protein DedD
VPSNKTKSADAPPATEVVKKTAVPIASPATHILSEFAAEADLAEPLGGARYRIIAIALLVVAVLLAASAAVYVLYFSTDALDVDAVALPAAPKWTTSVPAAAVPASLIRGSGSAAASPAAGREANDGTYAIQVASFESRDRADRLVAELNQGGFRARTVEFNLGPPRGIVLQIRVDGYADAQDAKRDLARIRELPGYADAHLLLK